MGAFVLGAAEAVLKAVGAVANGLPIRIVATDGWSNGGFQTPHLETFDVMHPKGKLVSSTTC